MTRNQVIGLILITICESGTFLTLFGGAMMLANRGKIYIALCIALVTQEISLWAMHLAANFQSSILRP